MGGGGLAVTGVGGGAFWHPEITKTQAIPKQASPLVNRWLFIGNELFVERGVGQEGRYDRQSCLSHELDAAFFRG